MSGRDTLIDLTALGASPPSGWEVGLLFLCGLLNLVVRDGTDGASLLLPSAIALTCIGYCLVTVWTRSARSLRACQVVLWAMFGWQSIVVLASGNYIDLRDLISTMVGVSVLFGFGTVVPAWIVGRVAGRLRDALVEERDVFGSRAPAWGFQFPLATVAAVAWSPPALAIATAGVFTIWVVFDGAARRGVDGRPVILALFLLIGFGWKLAKWVAGWTDLRQWLPRRTRPCTLYLRSHLDDGLEGENARIYGLRIPVADAEQPIVNALARFGLPLAVSAVGRVPSGCVRIGPFPGEAWQAVIRQEIRRAEAITCVLGITGGLEWEIRELLAIRPSGGTVFLLPPPTDRRHAREVPAELRILSLLAHIEEVTGYTHPLPPDAESLLGCVIGPDGLVWVRATPEHFSGYDRIVTVMIQLSRVGVTVHRSMDGATRPS